MRHLSLTLCVFFLAGCGLSDAPLDPGTFELTVTGDIEATATGRAIIAAPDSGLNVSNGEWTVRIPIDFDPEEADIDFGISVSEPVEPNGAFLELPDGEFEVGSTGEYDRTAPRGFVEVRVGRGPISIGGGVLRLRRTTAGVEGTLDSPYSSRGFGGSVTRGRVRARFNVASDS